MLWAITVNIILNISVISRLAAALCLRPGYKHEQSQETLLLSLPGAAVQSTEYCLELQTIQWFLQLQRRPLLAIRALSFAPSSADGMRRSYNSNHLFDDR